QKSIREGFGLLVSEPLWKGRPVVAGRAGGIPLQLKDSRRGYLVEDVDECADRIVPLLKDPEKAEAMGEAGREHGAEHFLMSRLIRDGLWLLAQAVVTSAGRVLGEQALLPGLLDLVHAW